MLLRRSYARKCTARPVELQTTAEAFAENLQGVIRTLSIPFQYTYSQVHSLHWQRAFLAERIRAGGTADDAEQAEVDRQNASRKFQEYLQGEGGKVLADEVVERLLHLQSERESLAAARELTRQGVVLTWSAIEVIARDTFVYLLTASHSFPYYCSPTRPQKALRY